MNTILELADAFFTACNWEHRRVANPDAIELRHAFSVEPFMSYAQVKNAERVFVYRSVCPERAPAERRDAVMRYITRVNFGQLIGAFEIDLDDGEVRFRTSLDLDGERMTDALLAGVIYPNHQAMTDYLPFLLQVIRGESEPDAAHREAIESLG